MQFVFQEMSLATTVTVPVVVGQFRRKMARRSFLIQSW